MNLIVGAGAVGAVASYYSNKDNVVTNDFNIIVSFISFLVIAFILVLILGILISIANWFLKKVNIR